MKLSKFILNDILPLYTYNSVRDLQTLFEHSTCSHLPILDQESNYIGCILRTDVFEFELGQPIETYHYALERFYVTTTTLWLDVLESFARNSTNIMPVLDTNNNYIGYYELNEVIGLFGDTPFFIDPGGTLVIQKGITDYSFSEICQIVESNEGQVLGVFISKMKADLVQVTLKIGRVSLNKIIQTFRRYNYQIISEHEDDNYLKILQERSKYLTKYLNT